MLGPPGRFDAASKEMVPTQNQLKENGEMAPRLTEIDGESTLFVSEKDVALLLQAKAAIGAGIEVLLDTVGIYPADIGRVSLTGGFGMHLNLTHAIAIGILPGFREEQVQVVGNTALAGAFISLQDRTMRDEMGRLRTKVKVVELNSVDSFEDRHIEHLMLP